MAKVYKSNKINKHLLYTFAKLLLFTKNGLTNEQNNIIISLPNNKGESGLKVFKERQFIVFEFDDGKTVKYNLATGETIGKNNRPVKSLNTQLRGYTIQNIIDSITDDNYRNFMIFINKEVNRSTRTDYNWGGYVSNRIVNKVSNVGSFLAKVNNYSKYEQYFACGLTNVDLDSRSHKHLRCSLNDIPKGLLKICREYNIKLNSETLRAYNKLPNLYPVLLDMEFNSITQDDIETLLNIWGEYFTKRENDYYYGSKVLYIKFLVENYNYNIKSLIAYLDNLMTYEAIENFSDLCKEFYDYVRMASQISNKFEKYPRYFLSTHRITCRNYNRLREVFEEQKFANRIDSELEYKIGDYKFIYPKLTQDIKDEAVQQANCVASYIKSVMDGNCHIMFLRKQNKNKPKDEQYNESLVTLEIRDYKVVQAKGKFNRECYKNEQELINQFNLYLQKVKNKREKQLKECVA